MLRRRLGRRLLGLEARLLLLRLLLRRRRRRLLRRLARRLLGVGRRVPDAAAAAAADAAPAAAAAASSIAPAPPPPARPRPAPPSTAATRAASSFAAFSAAASAAAAPPPAVGRRRRRRLGRRDELRQARRLRINPSAARRRRCRSPEAGAARAGDFFLPFPDDFLLFGDDLGGGSGCAGVHPLRGHLVHERSGRVFHRCVHRAQFYGPAPGGWAGARALASSATSSRLHLGAAAAPPRRDRLRKRAHPRPVAAAAERPMPVACREGAWASEFQRAYLMPAIAPTVHPSSDPRVVHRVDRVVHRRTTPDGGSTP